MIPLLPNIYVDRFEKKTYMLIGVKKKSKLFFFLLMLLSFFLKMLTVSQSDSYRCPKAETRVRLGPANFVPDRAHSQAEPAEPFLVWGCP
jgi:hypothetical protein